MVQRCKFSIELKNFPPDLSGEPIVAAMKELGKDNVTDEQVAIIKQAIEKYGSPDEIKYDYSIAPQWIKQRLAL